VEDTLGAFVPGAIIHRAPRGAGPLSGLSFAAKDLFDVAGVVTGCGNPDWAATHEQAEADAWAVDALLSAGATLVARPSPTKSPSGSRHQQILWHPLNPHAPDRVPGGSSSGSASAVAGGLIDVALGTTPAARCASPQASAASMACGRPMAASRRRHDDPGPSFDTVGYFADNAPTFGRAGRVLLGEEIVDALPKGSSSHPIVSPLQTNPCGMPCCRRSIACATSSQPANYLSRKATSPIGPATSACCRNPNFMRRFGTGSIGSTRASREVAGAFADDGRIAEGDVAPAKVFRARASQRLDRLLDGRRMLCLPTSRSCRSVAMRPCPRCAWPCAGSSI